MSANYAELKLYLGVCPVNWKAEGLVVTPSSPDKFFKPGWDFNLTYSPHSLVRDEREARWLISYAQRNIESSTGLILPHDQIKGRNLEQTIDDVRFYRVIRFDGLTFSDELRLLEKLEASGFDPYDSQVEQALTWATREDYDPEFVRTLEEHRDLTKPLHWNKALRFYTI